MYVIPLVILDFISVIKDLQLKEPFIGTIPIINGELGEDFAYYFNVSEQVPSAVSLGVLVGTDNRAIAAGDSLFNCYLTLVKKWLIN